MDVSCNNVLEGMMYVIIINVIDMSWKVQSATAATCLAMFLHTQFLKKITVDLIKLFIRRVKPGFYNFLT